MRCYFCDTVNDYYITCHLCGHIVCKDCVEKDYGILKYHANDDWVDVCIDCEEHRYDIS